MKYKKAQEIFSNLTMLIIFIIVVAVVGLLAGIIYYDMATIEGVLKTVDFALPLQVNNTGNNMSTFQDVLGIVAYPILGLRNSLPSLTYFLVFAFILALGMTAYLGSKNTIFFIVHILFLMLMTYFCIIISNMYSNLLTQSFINQMMVQFTIYNKLMLYLPQIVFITGLLFGAIAFVNLIKPQSASQATGLNYGGDY